MIKNRAKIGEYVFLAGWTFALVGLCFSPALMSIGVGLTVAGAIGCAEISRFKNAPVAWAWFLYGVLHFIALFYTENIPSGWDEIRIKAPLFILPLAFTVAPPLKDNQKRAFVYLFLTAVTTIAAATMVNYIINAEAIHRAMYDSKPIPILSPNKLLTHIYFSVLTAGAIFAGAWAFFSKQFLWKQRVEQTIIASTTLFLIVCLHVFTTRTGLVAFYAAAFFAAILYLKEKNARKIAVYVVATGVLASGVAFALLPSLRIRIQNTARDLRAYENRNQERRDSLENWSVSSRFLVWEMAKNSFIANPFWGVGPGDLKDEIFRAYNKLPFFVSPERRLTDVHNQFLETLAGLGASGGAVLIFALCFPFVRRSSKEEKIFTCLICVASGVESLLERQVGVTFFLYFGALWIFTPSVNTPKEAIQYLKYKV